MKITSEWGMSYHSGKYQLSSEYKLYNGMDVNHNSADIHNPNTKNSIS